jgi:hypothetical protein
MPEPDTLFINDFNTGWCPSDDPVNGRPNGCLQMNNLELDHNGALSLIGGTTVKRSGFSAAAHTLYSRFMSGTRQDYAACSDGSVYRNGASIVSGGDASNAAFATAFNFTLIASANKRYKDNGTSLVNLGVGIPGAGLTITQSELNAPWARIGNMQSNTVIPTGMGSVSVIGGNLIQCTTNASGVFVLQTYPGSSADCTTLSSVAGSGTSTDNDYVTINGYIANPSGVLVQFDVLLVTPDAAGDIVSDYYTYSVPDISQQVSFDSYTGAFTIRIPRSSFNRVGNGAYDWSTVYGFRLTINVNTPAATVINIWGPYQGQAYFVIQGGTIAQFGTYQYVQVNVNSTGSYIAKSTMGPISNPITLNGLCALITPRNPTLDDAQCNQAWIYRCSVNGNGLLNQWYRVMVFNGSWAAAYDNTGDQAALTLNLTLNLNLVSIASSGISDKIYDIVGPIQGRWYYFTTNMMYPSDINDPDLVDVSLAVRTCGSNNELFMFARAISASVVVVGTSCEVYLLTGTFTTFPDNSIDAYYQPLGVKFPPITYDAVAFGGAIYYLASDGWRMCMATSFGTTYSAQNNQLMVAPNTDRLYRGETCNGYTPPNIKITPGSVRFPVTIARNKLFCFITGTGRYEVYDFVRNYWRPVVYTGLGDVSAVATTQDGQILAFYTSALAEREIEIYTSKLIDGNTQQSVSLLLPFKDNGKPRERKDTYTFKSRCSVGAAGAVSLAITNELNVTTSVVNTLQNSSANEQYLDLSTYANLQLSKAYQIKLSGAVTDLVIEDLSIDYDARPVPVTFLRFQSINYGTTARKRLYTVPFQIDTMGQQISVVPYVDGVAAPALAVTSSRKQSFDYQFPKVSSTTDTTVGRDYEWTINGNGNEFEFFGFGQPRNIEIFPDQQTMFVIPVTNFKNPVKKRVRGWPFVINTLGNSTSFYPIVDGVTLFPTVFQTSDKQTVRFFYDTDVFGIDFSGYFTGGPFELWEILDPDIVQVLPPARQFDQIGPAEVFRTGKVIKMELRVLAFGTAIPYTVYFSDSQVWNGTFTTVNGVEDSYFVDIPKGVNGRILRMVLGPTAFNFHRYYMRFQVALSGDAPNSQLQWMTLPGGMSQIMPGGIQGGM